MSTRVIATGECLEHLNEDNRRAPERRKNRAAKRNMLFEKCNRNNKI